METPWLDTWQGRSLDQLYFDSKLNLNNGKDCPSYERCFHSCKWLESHITPPTGAYVGEGYENHRLLFVGINTNRGSKDSNDFYSVYKWISGEKTQISKYIDGAIHRIIQRKYSNSTLSPQETSQYFAFTNVVKCSLDKRAGHPTSTMHQNCSVKQEFLFKEISILKPSLIIALGSFPFEAIQNHYIDSVKSICNEFNDWLFSFMMDESRINVIRLYNPGQGYQNIRNVWKRIRSGEKIPDNWKRFIPEHLSSNNKLESYLEDRYDSGNRVDSSNPIYEVVVEKLLSISVK